MDPILFAAVGWLLCAPIACTLAGPDKRGDGFVVGLLFGPLGVVMAVMLGNRASAERAAFAALHATHRTTRPSTPLNSTSNLADVPDHLTIRRDGEVIGTWPLEDVLTFLNSGELVPTDHYLHDPASQTWRLLRRIA